MDEMLEAMYAAPGVGLSATQIGVAERFVVVDIEAAGSSQRPWRMVNPEILWRSPETSSDMEGCLSFPQQYAEVIRPNEIKVRYTDEHGKEQEMSCDGLLARCIQHETDHLDGILFIDHISKLKRDIIMRKSNKLRRANEG